MVERFGKCKTRRDFDIGSGQIIVIFYTNIPQFHAKAAAAQPATISN
jgi:hypothetical protein